MKVSASFVVCYEFPGPGNVKQLTHLSLGRIVVHHAVEIHLPVAELLRNLDTGFLEVVVQLVPVGGSAAESGNLDDGQLQVPGLFFCDVPLCLLLESKRCQKPSRIVQVLDDDFSFAGDLIVPKNRILHTDEIFGLITGGWKAMYIVE